MCTEDAEYGVPLPKLGILLCVLCGSLAAGCDPVRTTLQPVHLRITNSPSAQPVAGAQICLRYDYHRAVPLSQQVPSDREFWSQMPWYSGVTDNYGKADVGIKYTSLDRTIGPTPPSWTDWVSGKHYLVKVRQDQEHEEFSLVMRPGASGQGKLFTVHILEIHEPRYVKTD